MGTQIKGLSHKKWGLKQILTKDERNGEIYIIGHI